VARDADVVYELRTIMAVNTRFAYTLSCGHQVVLWDRDPHPVGATLACPLCRPGDRLDQHARRSHD